MAKNDACCASKHIDKVQLSLAVSGADGLNSFVSKSYRTLIILLKG